DPDDADATRLRHQAQHKLGGALRRGRITAAEYVSYLQALMTGNKPAQREQSFNAFFAERFPDRQQLQTLMAGNKPAQRDQSFAAFFAECFPDGQPFEPEPDPGKILKCWIAQLIVSRDTPASTNDNEADDTGQKPAREIPQSLKMMPGQQRQ